MAIASAPYATLALVLLNIDAGELPNEPEALYQLAHLVNIACGGHIGDTTSMRTAVTYALAHHTGIGAHPSYDDREGFGRVSLEVSLDELAASVERQCRDLAKICRELSARVEHVKPHGALYHDTHRSEEIARVVFNAARRALGSDIVFVAQANGALQRLCEQHDARFFAEVFADRGARPDGSLIPRGQPGALITNADEAAARARALVTLGQAQTVCVHGDTANAVEIAKAVRSTLDEMSRAPA
ncbi:MAG: 5-oxoprolinase subunit PxpA [Polyangiaceae bacterium]